VNFWLKTKKRKYHHLSFFLIQNSPFCLINYDSSKRLIINQPLSIVERMERSSFPCTNHPWPQARLGRENLCWGQLCPDMGPATNPETFFLLFFSLNLTGLQTAKGLHPSKFLGQVSLYIHVAKSWTSIFQRLSWDACIHCPQWTSGPTFGRHFDKKKRLFLWIAEPK